MPSLTSKYHAPPCFSTAYLTLRGSTPPSSRGEIGIPMLSELMVEGSQVFLIWSMSFPSRYAVYILMERSLSVRHIRYSTGCAARADIVLSTAHLKLFLSIGFSM